MNDYDTNEKIEKFLKFDFKKLYYIDDQYKRAPQIGQKCSDIDGCPYCSYEIKVRENCKIEPEEYNQSSLDPDATWAILVLWFDLALKGNSKSSVFDEDWIACPQGNKYRVGRIQMKAELLPENETLPGISYTLRGDTLITYKKEIRKIFGTNDKFFEIYEKYKDKNFFVCCNGDKYENYIKKADIIYSENGKEKGINNDHHFSSFILIPYKEGNSINTYRNENPFIFLKDLQLCYKKNEQSYPKLKRCFNKTKKFWENHISDYDKYVNQFMLDDFEKSYDYYEKNINYFTNNNNCDRELPKLLLFNQYVKLTKDAMRKREEKIKNKLTERLSNKESNKAFIDNFDIVYKHILKIETCLNSHRPRYN